LNDKKLKKLLKYWQEHLRLQDWEIEITFETAVPFGGVGICVKQAQYKSAQIQVQVPECRIDVHDDWSDKLKDIYTERVVVHELLHLMINVHKEIPFKDRKNNADAYLEEVSVNTLDTLLVNLKYGITEVKA